MSLPGGWDVKDPVYFTAPSQTFGDGDKVIYGQRGEVVGLATLESHKGNGVAVQFPGNKKATDCYHFQVSREPQSPLPGGWKLSS